MEIKVTLQYSNPQIMRELALPKEFTAKQLYQAICISTEWDTGRTGTFYRNGKVLEDSAKITEELFEENATLACVVGNVEQPDWNFRIEQVESPDPTLQPEYPIVMRHRGSVITKNVKNVSEMNRYKNGWCSDSDEISLIIVNTKLEIAFEKNSAKSAEAVNFVGRSCTGTLNYMTVEELKKIEKLLNMDHSATLLKRQRVQKIAQDYMTDINVMRRILELMSSMEYEAFLKMYEERASAFARNYEERFLYRTLLYYGLVTIKDNGQVLMSVELIQGAKHFMKDVIKAESRRKHAAKAVIEAGTQLYGFVNAQLYNVLLESCYSGLLTQEQKKAYWAGFVNEAQARNTGFIWLHHFSVFARSDAELYSDTIIKYCKADVAKHPFYIPERELVEKIELHGSTIYTETIESLLKAMIGRFHYTKETIFDYAYAAIQNCVEGQEPEEIMPLIFNSLGSGRYGKGIKQMTSELKRTLSQIRQPQYFGHTKEEYEALTGGKQK